VLIPTGNLMILSANRYIIWSTSTQHLNSADQEKTTYANGTFMMKNEKFSYPFKLTLTDEGLIVITDKSDQKIWDSSPLNLKAVAYNIFEPIEYAFVPCDREGKPKKSKRDLLSFEEANNRVNKNEKLLSSNGIWDLTILQNKTLAIRKLNVITHVLYELPEEKRGRENMNDLILEEDGSLTLKNENHRIIKYLFKPRVKLFSEKFTLKLSKNGQLSIETVSNTNNTKTIWQFPRPKVYNLLESNGIYNLKTSETLIAKDSNENSISLVLNQQDLTLVSSNNVSRLKKISIPCLSKQKCLLDELVLRHDGNLVLIDNKARIVWESNSKVEDYTKLGPFKLSLDEKLKSLTILNRLNVTEWKMILE